MLLWALVLSLLASPVFALLRASSYTWSDEALARIVVPEIPDREPALVFVHGSWTERISGRLQGNGMRLDSIESVQNGSESFGSPDWTANYDDAFVSLGTGLRLRQIADRMDLTVDLRNSDSVSELNIDTLATGRDRFPDFETRYSALRVRLDYRWSERLLLELGLTWRSFESDDWMRQGVDPATMPAVLTLGAEPWDDSQVLLGLGFRYDLATPDAAAE